MKNTIRFGGAQIPVTPDIQQNIKTIKKAIDWAAENKVDYLVTPEASLSGYYTADDASIKSVATAMSTIEKYAAKEKIGLCLGTIWDEIEVDATVRRNQIRFYSQRGMLCGVTNKKYAIEFDRLIGVKGDNTSTLIPLPTKDKLIPVGGLICIDMYVSAPEEMTPVLKLWVQGAKLIIHSTNAARNVLTNKNLSAELTDKIANDWHDICLRRASFLTNIPIITVDNCYMADGTEYHGPTSSESGVLISGEWVTKIPRTGTQYFYYDFNIDDVAIDWQKN
jgi:predicted amidohydrolase